MSITRRLSLVVSTLACVALMAAAAGAREPRSGVARSGSAHREVTRTGPNGHSQTWQSDSSWQRGNGQFDRHTTQTGPRGATRSKDVHAERTDTGYTRTSHLTRPDGSSIDVEKTVSHAASAPGSAAAE